MARQQQLPRRSRTLPDFRSCHGAVSRTMECPQDQNTKPCEKEEVKGKQRLDVTSLVWSAPSSTKFRTVTPEIQQTIDKCTKQKSASSLESKHRCTITSERLAQLRKNVEGAMRDHKVFTVRGCWPVIRRELLKRNWLEKFEGKAKVSVAEDVTSNLPARCDWESPSSYVDKCERTVMSRMLQSTDVDLYWSMKKDQVDMQHRGNAYKLINRFSRSLFASKEGLALLLQQAYWYTEEGLSNVNFPRCYVLGFPDHYNLFVDDFRMTACIGFLKWFVEKYEHDDKQSIQSLDGKVPYTAIQFALDRCNEYIASQRHVDIDKEFNRIWDHEWEQFLSYYYLILHQQGQFHDFKESLTTTYATIKATLKEIAKYWSQYDIDGMKNIWILKPGNKCRGRGIQLIKTIAEVDKIMTLKLKYVVQKYIERPLIVYRTKFDIRQWFMVTNVQPLTIWMYRDSYLRFSSQIFSLDNFHESLHLTNHAVQCKYSNMQQRDKALPEENMWDCHTFKAYLKTIGAMDKWNDVIFPGMRESIICAMLSSQDTMDRRQNTFEIYGADFILCEDYKPWLLEINCSPDLSFSTNVTKRLCPQCMEDIIKVVVDRRKETNADTGLFQLIYKQNYPKTPPYLGMNLSVRGRKIFRNRVRSSSKGERDKSENKDKNIQRMLKKHESIKSQCLAQAIHKTQLPKILTQDIYRGPVISDFIQELQRAIDYDDDSGVDFVPASRPAPVTPVTPIKLEPKKKSGDPVPKSERVHRQCLSRRKANRCSSFCRRPSASDGASTPLAQKPRPRSYFGLLKQWAVKNKVATRFADEVWERETVSILRGENILNKAAVKHNSSATTDVNKNLIKQTCFNAQTFDLNKLLPQIKSCDDSRPGQ